jgi:hypothetical protein
MTTGGGPERLRRDHLKPNATDEPITSPEVLRPMPTITALESIHAPESRVMVERLAQGNPAAIATLEARLTLNRSDRPAFPSQ